MAKMVEIKYMKEMKELEKLNARLERAQKTLEKKQANAEKLGVANWTGAEHSAWMDTVETRNGFIVNKADIKLNGAWFDLRGARREVEDLKGQIERAEGRFEKVEQEIAEYRAQVENLEDMKRKEELRKLEFEAEKKEWEKDGIVLEARYNGKTPSGKGFAIVRNGGCTIRSRHCFTLYLEGQGVVFTSGEFWRAYNIIKNS